MKIGKFASLNNVSIDTIRHYIDMGLLQPERNGYHYNFDRRCSFDLCEIKSLKSMGFELIQIKAILIFNRLGKMSSLQKNEWYQDIYKNKLNDITLELDEIIDVKTRLEESIKKNESSHCQLRHTVGIDFFVLNLFACPDCKSEFELLEGAIQNNKIVSGILKCRCGTELRIIDGIVCHLDAVDKIEKNNDHFITDYLCATNNDFLEHMHKLLEWFYKKFEPGMFKNKTVLDLGSGSGFFLRYIFDLLDDNTLYIAVDNDINRHKSLKKLIEVAETPKNVIFICCDFDSIPIKEQSVDIVIDILGTSYYALENTDILLDRTNHLFRDEVKLIAGYMIYNKFGKDSTIVSEYRHNYKLDYVKKYIQELGFTCLAEKSDIINSDAGKYEDLCNHQDEVLNYHLLGIRDKK